MKMANSVVYWTIFEGGIGAVPRQNFDWDQRDSDLDDFLFQCIV
jgi:hypothetical protein